MPLKSDTCDDLKKNDAENTTSGKKYMCKYCKKCFTQQGSKNRHIKSVCKVKKEEDNIIQELLKEMEEMKEKIIKLEKENKQTINNTINNNNINLVAYGEENLTEVTSNTMKKILKCGFQAPYLFKNVHFNKLRPQYHNIHISNMRDNNIIVYDGIKWNLVDRNTTLRDIIERYEDVIERKYYELEDELDEFTIRKLDRFIDQYCEKENIDMYKKDLTLLLYNNRKLIN